MNNDEQQLKDLKERYDLLIRAVHEMNDLIGDLRDENEELKKIIEEFENAG